MSTLLLTGGAGYVGSHAAKYLSQKGYSVVVYDNLVYGHPELARWGPLEAGSLGDRKRLQEVFRRYRPEGILHFAAYAYVGESVQEPAKYYRNNVAETLTLLEVMREEKVPSLVFSSSCAVYGHPREIPIPEDHERKPINPYGRSKLMVELMLEDFRGAYGLRFASLRYFNAAGADPEGETGEDHDPETHLIPLVLDAALGRRPHVTVFGTDYPTSDGTCVRDYVHVTDLAQAHWQAYEWLRSGGESLQLNLGNGNGYSVRQVIDTAHRVTGREIPVQEGARRPGDPAELVGSSRRAQELLGWTPEYPDLETIVETAWNWHRKRFGS